MRKALAAIAAVILAFVTALSGQTIDYSKKPLQSERSRSFDAANELIKEATFPKEMAEFLYQLKNDDVIGRMTAAGELAAAAEQPAVVTELARCARSDPF